VRFGILKKENEKMKKLIMMLAVVCSIGMAQAAFVDWQFGKDTAYNDYTVYAFDSANSATVLAALGAFDADALSTIEGLVLSSKNVSKGNAIYGLCKFLKIDINDVIAIGDGINDISMIKVVGLGVAMENGEPEVKAVAKEITTTNLENGVAKVLKEKF
jgi:hydroxymethylpyrimidine pyrophosphatase-like HAD family hydrolase